MDAVKVLRLGLIGAVFLCFVTLGPAWAEYDVRGDVVVDTESGLMWMRDTADTNGDGSATSADKVNWRNALAFCEGLSFAGHSDWRLPNVNELQSLVRIDAYGPAIDAVFSCVSSGYWSGSPYAGDSDYAWYVPFYNGYASDDSKDVTNYVRCVRSGP